MLVAGNRIHDRGAFAIDNFRNKQLSKPAVDIDFDVDWAEDRVVNGVHRCCKDVPHGGAGLGLFAIGNFQQGFALCGVGAFVVPGIMVMAIPLMQRLGKAPYVNFMTIPELEKKIEVAGFKIVEVGNYPVSPPSHFVVARKI